jgi:hypothetical protein
MPNTYTELRRTVLGTATASVTFDLTGVSGYTDLVIIATGTASALGNLSLRFNGDTGNNYSRTQLYGNGSSATSYRVSNYSGIPLGDFDTSQIATHIINIQNYSNATTNKTVLARWNNNAGTYASLGATASLWRNTAAITSITIYDDAGNLSTGSTFSLYGIANADQGAAKATGGIITEDSQYWYHTFGASGAFIPKQSLTCDVLVVAGGGSAGYDWAAGGGAGGVQYLASTSLTATTYNIAVGAGGPGGIGTNSNGTDSTFNSTTIIAKGGGRGANPSQNGGNGGSGGGGNQFTNQTGGSAVAGTGGTHYGNAGGNGYRGGSAQESSGGGGGAGAVGANGSASLVGGAGGIGTSLFSSWGITTGTGELSGGVRYYAGGGGGAGRNGAGAGGLGGGKSSGNGTPNTGGGGGADANSGGSGIVIVRYPK